jgi:hypothetical protein
VVSRGGVEEWYSSIAGGYVDLVDVIGAEEVELAAGLLPFGVSKPDAAARQLQRSIEDAVVGEHGDAAWLRPELLTTMFQRVWQGRSDLHHLVRSTEHRRIRMAAAGEALRLPDDYIAVHLGFTPWFPDTPRNREIAAEVLERVSAHAPVLLLRPPFGDEHGASEIVGSGATISLSEELDPRRRLAVQSAVLANARGFVGTYGSYSHIATALGVSNVGLYADGTAIAPVDVDVTKRAATETGAAFTLAHVDALQHVATIFGTHTAERDRNAIA